MEPAADWCLPVVVVGLAGRQRLLTVVLHRVVEVVRACARTRTRSACGSVVCMVRRRPLVGIVLCGVVASSRPRARSRLLETLRNVLTGLPTSSKL